MSNWTKAMPGKGEIQALARLAAAPQYRKLIADLDAKSGTDLVDTVFSRASPEWFEQAGLPLPANARVSPRIFEDPARPLREFDLNQFAPDLHSVTDPNNPLFPILNGTLPPFKSPGLNPPKPVPGGVSPNDPRALTICGSLGAGVGITACLSVG